MGVFFFFFLFFNCTNGTKSRRASQMTAFFFYLWFAFQELLVKGNFEGKRKWLQSVPECWPQIWWHDYL